MYTLEFLVKALQHAKKDEEVAREGRIEVEKKIAALIETKEVGQKTVKLTDGSKVTVKRGLNYKADISNIFAHFDDTPFHPPIKTEIRRYLDTKGYEWYKENQTEMFDVLSRFVTVTPKKIAVTLQAPKE